MQVFSPPCEGVLPGGYWPAWAQCGCPGGYETKRTMFLKKTKQKKRHHKLPVLQSEAWFWYYLYTQYSLMYGLFVRPVVSHKLSYWKLNVATDIKLEPTVRWLFIPVALSWWKGCGMCMLGSSCCLGINTGLAGFGSQQESVVVMRQDRCFQSPYPYWAEQPDPCTP